MPNMNDIIGSNPLAQTLQQRGIPLSALSNVSPSAANFQPDMQVPPYGPMPNKTPITLARPELQAGGPSMPPAPPTGQPMPPQGMPQAATQMPPGAAPTMKKEITEEEHIVKALVSRLHALTKLKGGGV